MDLIFLFNRNIKTHRNGQTVLENIGSIRATAPCEVIQSTVFLQSSGQISCSVPYSMFFAMMYQACAPGCVCVCVLVSRADSTWGYIMLVCIFCSFDTLAVQVVGASEIDI